MSDGLTWVGAYLYPEGRETDALGEVRTRCEGLEWDFVTYLGLRKASERYERKEDAYQDCESEVRRLLKSKVSR